MASHVVGPKNDAILIECSNCSTLYAADPKVHPHGFAHNFEKCPVCGYGENNKYNRIPLWKYNLKKFFRGKWNE